MAAADVTFSSIKIQKVEFNAPLACSRALISGCKTAKKGETRDANINFARKIDVSVEVFEGPNDERRPGWIFILE